MFPENARRLRDGAVAMSLIEIEPADINSARILHQLLRKGAVALQSTDDLGSEELNQSTWDNMVALDIRMSYLAKKFKI